MPGSASLTAFAGQTPPWSLTSLDSNFTNLNALAKDVGNYTPYLVDAGAANAYAGSYAGSLTFTLAVGVGVMFKAANSNTGASTLNVNGTGAKSIKNLDGSALTAGQISSNGIHHCIYDGTNYVLLTPMTFGTATTWTPTIGGSTTAGTQTYSTQTGRYIASGSLVVASGVMVMTAKDVATAGNLRINGFPFSFATTSPVTVSEQSNFDLDVAGFRYQLVAQGFSGSAFATMLEVGDNVAAANLTSVDLNATSTLKFAVAYERT